MTDTASPDSPQHSTRVDPLLENVPGVGEPVSSGWREGTLTRAKELESLSRWVWRSHGAKAPEPRTDQEFLVSIGQHIAAAREAANCKKRRMGSPRQPSLLERAMSNLDAAEAQLINLAPPEYLLGQMPSLLNHVQRHLVNADPRRKQFEHLAERLGFKDPDDPLRPSQRPSTLEDKKREIEQERTQIASIVRGASSAALREQLRVRSFRNVVVGTIGFMTVLAIAVAVIGLTSPATIPLCFHPERGGQTMVVCPTGQSALVPVAGGVGSAPDVDDVVKRTAAPQDLLVIEFIGLAAAAVAAAVAIRGIRGSSERYGLPVALTVLKLPTGALTAVLGLLLMRGQFVPGLSALDTSAQILAWALVFGYAQQLFTRLVDQQAHDVLDGVRGGTEAAGGKEEKVQR